MRHVLTVYAAGSGYIERLQARLMEHKIETEIRVTAFGRQIEIWGHPSKAGMICAISSASRPRE